MSVCVYIYICMDTWIHGYMDTGMRGCMDGWMDGWMDG